MSGKLETYRSKRSAQKTPEPMGEEAAGADGRRFVIQEHHATRLHWDLRLEHDGVLVSFAIPNGLPEAPKDNRLAVHTEDHPLEYLEFEGEIPKGQYGAGTMRIWDRGTYEVLKWEPRKIEVLLHGERVQGRYALFPDRQGRGPQELDDPPDGPARRRGGGAPMPEKIVPMMARTGTLPRDDEHWAFEVKWDGVRAICHSEPGRMRLHSRNLLDITPRYPEVGRLNRALSHHRAILDGEVVALDAEGRPSFGALQRRMHVGLGVDRPAAGQGRAGHLHHLRPAVARRALAHGPALHRAPRAPGRARARRRRALARARLRRRPRRAAAGRHASSRASRASSPSAWTRTYEPGRRTPAWLKIKKRRRQEVVVGGWVPGDGKRRDRIGALLVGVREDDGALRHVGRVGTGFTEAELDRLAEMLRPLEREDSPVRARRPEDPARRRLRRPRARGRGRVPRVDRRRPAARALLQGPARRQARRARRARGGQRDRSPRSAGARSSSRTSTRSSIPRPASPSATSSTTSRASRRPSCRTSRAAR